MPEYLVSEIQRQRRTLPEVRKGKGDCVSTNRRPWYKWYPKDFATDEKVKSLSPISELVYRRLLDVMWQSSACILLNDCLRLANASGAGLTRDEFENAWNEIQTSQFELFKTTDDGKFIYSKRLKEQIDEIEKRSKSGSLGGIKRAQSKFQAKLKQNSSKNQAKSTDTDTDINNTLCVENDARDFDFDHFWEAYGKKVDRQKCFSKWKRLKQSDRDMIFKTLSAYVASTPDIQYRKNPSTYLNNRSWENETQQATISNTQGPVVPRSEIITYRFDEHGRPIIED